MKLKDLIGHKIIDISDNVEFMIKTDKGIYTLDNLTYPDGTLSSIYIEESNEGTWDCFNGEDN